MSCYVDVARAGTELRARSGFNVITTCSPRNFELVKERGADQVCDYHDFDKCAKNIKKSVGDELQYAYVCVFGEEPAKVNSTTPFIATSHLLG